MSDPLQKSPPASEAVTPQPSPGAAPAPRPQSTERRRSSGGVYDWLIPLILIFLALVLASIIIASVIALMGLWPGA